MFKRIALLLCATLVSAHAVAAQTKPATAPAKPSTNAEAKAETQAAKAAAEPAGLPLNVKLEVSITDQTGTGQPAKKTITMLTSDRQSNSIRSSAIVMVKNQTGTVNTRSVTINVDAWPKLIAREPNKVLVAFGLEYFPKSAGGAEELEPGMSQLNERLSLVLESGKPTIISQAADPMSDRRITVEVTATIVK